MHTVTKTIFAILVPFMAFSQIGPIDFESGGHGAAWTWTVFENDSNPALEIIPNPDATGINTSATVAKFTALQAGNPWAGCETLHGAGTGSFFIDASNAQIRIMVWKSQISDVGIKLVRPDGWSLGEIKVANTITNQWEQLTFDFTSHIGLTPAYDQVVIFPDFTARAGDEIIYFDNVFGPAISFGIDELEETEVRLFPNPGKNILTIESEHEIEKLQIYSISGALVYSNIDMDKQITLNVEGTSSGVYFVHITSISGTETLRWIKQD